MKPIKHDTPSATPEEYRGLHKFLLVISTFFFIYLVVEGFVLVPLLFTRYGMH